MDTVQDHLERLDVDAILLTSISDVEWACGFSGSNGLLLVRNDGAVFLTDGRYETQAKREVQGARVIMGGHDLLGHVAEAGLLAGCRRAAFQSDDVSVATYESLTKQFTDIEWIGAKELLAPDVAPKCDEAVDRMRAAQRLSETVLEDVLEWIRPGTSEKEIAAEIVCRHLRLGAEKMSFEPIVASGPHSALPHGQPTNRNVGKGDVLLLDFGCVVDGYASDMTRTIAIGEPDDDVREVYEVVRLAQRRAISAARSNMRSSDLDAVARDVIKKAGYGEFFSHGLGHGVGRRVHEWPRVSYTTDYALPDRCVVTIEPGVYLPDRFGIRIEDMVQLRSTGCDNLTNATTELVVI